MPYRTQGIYNIPPFIEVFGTSVVIRSIFIQSAVVLVQLTVLQVLHNMHVSGLHAFFHLRAPEESLSGGTFPVLSYSLADQGVNRSSDLSQHSLLLCFPLKSSLLVVSGHQTSTMKRSHLFTRLELYPRSSLS